MDKAKIKDIYEKLNAENDLDILHHFPTRYDPLVISDLTKVPSTYMDLVVFGIPKNIKLIKRGSLIRFQIEYNSHLLPINFMIYNQPFYANVLYKKDIKFYFFGYYSLKSKCGIISLVLTENSLLVKHPYKPYYKLPIGVSQSSFYQLINLILEERGGYLYSNLPKYLIEKYKLEDIYNAYKDVHIPISKLTIQRGLRVFKYTEALKYALYNLFVLSKKEKIKKSVTTKINKLKINEFVSNLPFKLTFDQIKAINEIVLDMDSSTLMNRLLEGDVGTGKTIVAFTCLYASYLRGGQSVLLAPTQTLASQHYLNALKIFKNYNIKIALLDNKTSNSKLLKEIENGNIDIVIGTHAVFSSKVKYKNLTFAIIDEQHKFGVSQRQEIYKKGKYLDVLMMSATPIPQTLTKIIISDLNVSILKQFPFKNRNVVTKVVSSTDKIIYESISKALLEKKQVYVVAPKIENNGISNKLSTNYIYDELVEKFGQDNVLLLHGKQKSDEQEKIYEEFVSGKKLILVSTSLIEVGVDVKNACLMVVYEANYFGLASLHQLRGRIGRNGQKALALLVYDKDDKEALDKLNFLANTSDGEKIAVYDLQHRGGGDLLSYRQTGASILQVANFVLDKTIFEYAKKDAEEILANLNVPENKLFLEDCLKEVEKLSSKK